jgi:TP901 family phage tail tape measure protein
MARENEIELDFDRSTRRIQENLRRISGEFRVTGQSAQASFGKDTTQVFESVSGTLGRLPGVLGSAASSFGSFGSAVGAAAGPVGIAVTAIGAAIGALGTLAVGSVRAAAKVETALANLSTISESSDFGTGRFRELARQTSLTFGSDIQTQVNSFYSAVSAGARDTAEAAARLNAANLLAVGGSADLGEAMKGLSAAVNVYKDSNQSASDVADQFFVGAKLGVITIEEFSRNIGTVAPVANAAGVALDNVTAGLATLTKGGVTANVAATQLRALFNSILNPAQQARKVAAELGIAWDTAALRSKGLAGFLKTLRDSGASEEQIAKLTGSSEALSAVLLLNANAGENFAGVLSGLEDRAGAAESAAAKMANTFDNQVKRVSSALSAVLESLGSVILPALGPALDFVGRQARGFALFIEQSTAVLEEQARKLDAVVDFYKQVFEVIAAVNIPIQVYRATIGAAADEVDRLAERSKRAIEATEDLSEAFRLASANAGAFGTGGLDIGESGFQKRQRELVEKEAEEAKKQRAKAREQARKDAEKRLADNQRAIDAFNAQLERASNDAAVRGFRDRLQKDENLLLDLLAIPNVAESATELDRRIAEVDARAAVALEKLRMRANEDAENAQAYEELKTQILIEAEEAREKVREDFRARELAANEAALNEAISISSRIGSAFSAVLGNIGSFVAQEYGKRDRRIRESTERELALLQASGATKEQLARASIAIETQAAQESNRVQREAFEVNRGIQLAQAVVSVATGVANALATPPPWFGLALAAAVGLAGAVQVATIASAQPGAAPSLPSIPSAPSPREARDVDPFLRQAPSSTGSTSEREASVIRVTFTGPIDRRRAAREIERLQSGD